MASRFRLYFFLPDGTELADHPLNGAQWNGSGSGVTTDGIEMMAAPRDAEFWRDRSGRIARFRFWVQVGRSSVEVTSADFPGHRHILVKFWHPEETEWCWLVPVDNRVAARSSNRSLVAC